MRESNMDKFLRYGDTRNVIHGTQRCFLVEIEYDSDIERRLDAEVAYLNKEGWKVEQVSVWQHGEKRRVPKMMVDGYEITPTKVIILATKGE